MRPYRAHLSIVKALRSPAIKKLGSLYFTLIDMSPDIYEHPVELGLHRIHFKEHQFCVEEAK